MGKIILVTGAARSGKSEWAEYLAWHSQQPVTYIATAPENTADPEWTARIQRHRDRRPTTWQIIAEPLALQQTLEQLPPNRYVLVDSLGLWVANHLELDSGHWEQQTAILLAQLPQLPITISFVAEETGWGIVPAYELGRLFRDRLGHLIRQLGAIAEEAYLVTGGHALNLKQLGSPLPPHPFPEANVSFCNDFSA